MIAAVYGISAVRVTQVDGAERAELLRFSCAGDLLELPELLAEYRTAYAGRDDVRLDLDTTPTG